MEDKKDYAVGEWVWWIDAWRTMRGGTIYGFEDTKNGLAALIYENGRKGSRTGALVKDCWPDKQTCLDKDAERSARQVEEYKKNIVTVHDLVKFLYEHDVNSEYMDYDAKKAAEERAAELGVPVC